MSEFRELRRSPTPHVLTPHIICPESKDLGFPDLYRVLPGGEKVFVPKMGSMWGGLTPEFGSYRTTQQPWCYSPGYFAPAHIVGGRGAFVRLSGRLESACGPSAYCFPSVGAGQRTSPACGALLPTALSDAL